MGWYRDRILPRIIDRSLDTAEVASWRRRAIDGIAGVVVQPGFGSGLDLPLLPPEVTTLYAVDPALLGRELARERIAASPIEVRFVGLDGERIPLDDDSCDAGLLTYTLCTIPDPGAALAELRRVIRPGGHLHFLEHGKAPTARMQRWQRRIDPIQRLVADGCHVSRDHPALLEEAGFEIQDLHAGYGRGPKPWTHYYVGRALNP